jgi:threonine dehydratase
MTTTELILPNYGDILRAAQRLAMVAHRTPVLTSRSLDQTTGAQLHFKCENLQRAGAFKFRGAYNAIATLDDDVRRRGVIAYSSGNHAQALALAGRLQGVAVTVVMPHDAPAMKIAAARGYGAEIHLYDRYTENREAIGRAMAEARGLALIPPYDHPEIIAGQATAAAELFAATGPLDLLLVPLGGGGLLAGSALAAGALSPRCRVIGVEPAAGDDGRQSLLSGKIVRIAPPRSIADGAAVTHLGDHNFAIIQRRVADIVTVDDADLVAAMTALAERMKMIVEPTGCLGLAAALSGAVAVRGLRVGIVLSGGNVDLQTFARLMAPGVAERAA